MWLSPRCTTACCLGLAIAVAGCDPKPADWLQTFPVTGRVFDAEGKPAAGAVVVLHPAGQRAGRRLHPQGRVGLGGSFAITTYLTGDGAPAGEYGVSVLWPVGSDKQFDKQGEFIGRAAEEGPDRLKGRFNNRKSPVCTAIVKDGNNELEPIHLK